MQPPQVPRHSRRKSQSQLSRSSSAGSPVETTSRPPSNVAFVQVDAGLAGVSNEARRAVRVQAAKSSAAARKRTIARKRALERGAAEEDDEQTDGITRRHSLPSPLAIDIETAVSSPAVSVSSSPTLSLRHTDSSPSAYPTTLRYDQIPTVVAYFLTYFAPTADPSIDRRGRELLREQLWPQALKDQSLFHACLLIAGSHAYATGALHVPMDLLSQAKHIAIVGINSAVSRALPNEQVPEPIIAAIALLGGWEVEYGDPNVYDTHMRGLQTIIRLRGGLFQGDGDTPRPNAQPLSAATVLTVLCVGHNLCMYSGRTPYFENPRPYTPHNLSPLPSTMPAGLLEMHEQQLFHDSLVVLIAALHTLDLAHPDRNPDENHPPPPTMTTTTMTDASMSRLVEINTALLAWDHLGINAAHFCPLQTQFEDHLNSHAHQLVRLAGLAMCGRLLSASASSPTPPSTSSSSSSTSPSTQRDHQDLHFQDSRRQQWTALPPPVHTVSTQEIHAQCLRIDLEAFPGTVYDSIALWALFALCAATASWDARTVGTLSVLRTELGIDTLESLRTGWLERYAWSWSWWSSPSSADASAETEVDAGTGRGGGEEETGMTEGPREHGGWGDRIPRLTPRTLSGGRKRHAGVPGLEASARSLWEAVESAAGPGRMGNGGTSAGEPTRYSRGIPHPTLQIGAAIAANEMEHLIEVPASRQRRGLMAGEAA